MLFAQGSDATRQHRPDAAEPRLDRQGRPARRPRPTQLLADFDAALADGAKIAGAGAAGQQFVIADGWIEGSTVSIRMLRQGSLSPTSPSSSA